MKSSLSFGQAVFTFSLPKVTSCSSYWMILFKDYLPGNLAQLNFKKLLAQQENLLVPDYQAGFGSSPFIIRIDA